MMFEDVVEFEARPDSGVPWRAEATIFVCSFQLECCTSYVIGGTLLGFTPDE